MQAPPLSPAAEAEQSCSVCAAVPEHLICLGCDHLVCLLCAGKALPRARPRDLAAVACPRCGRATALQLEVQQLLAEFLQSDPGFGVITEEAEEEEEELPRRPRTESHRPGSCHQAYSEDLSQASLQEGAPAPGPADPAPLACAAHAQPLGFFAAAGRLGCAQCLREQQLPSENARPLPQKSALLSSVLAASRDVELHKVALRSSAADLLARAAASERRLELLAASVNAKFELLMEKVALAREALRSSLLAAVESSKRSVAQYIKRSSQQRNSLLQKAEAARPTAKSLRDAVASLNGGAGPRRELLQNNANEQLVADSVGFLSEIESRFAQTAERMYQNCLAQLFEEAPPPEPAVSAKLQLLKQSLLSPDPQLKSSNSSLFAERIRERLSSNKESHLSKSCFEKDFAAFIPSEKEMARQRLLDKKNLEMKLNAFRFDAPEPLAEATHGFHRPDFVKLKKFFLS